MYSTVATQTHARQRTRSVMWRTWRCSIHPFWFTSHNNNALSLLLSNVISFVASGCSYVSGHTKPTVSFRFITEGEFAMKEHFFPDLVLGVSEWWSPCVLGCTVLCVFQQQKWLLYESWLCSGGVTVEEMSMHSWSCSAHMPQTDLLDLCRDTLCAWFQNHHSHLSWHCYMEYNTKNYAH